VKSFCRVYFTKNKKIQTNGCCAKDNIFPFQKNVARHPLQIRCEIGQLAKKLFKRAKFHKSSWSNLAIKLKD